jgi:hypothetical protein
MLAFPGSRSQAHFAGLDARFLWASADGAGVEGRPITDEILVLVPRASVKRHDR